MNTVCLNPRKIPCFLSYLMNCYVCSFIRSVFRTLIVLRLNLNLSAQLLKNSYVNFEEACNNAILFIFTLE